MRLFYLDPVTGKPVFLLSVYCFLSFERCLASVALRWWNCKCVVKCEGGEKREERKESLSFLFYPPSHIPSFALPLPHIFPASHFTTHVQLHHRSAKEATQCPKDKKQK